MYVRVHLQIQYVPHTRLINPGISSDYCTYSTEGMASVLLRANVSATI